MQPTNELKNIASDFIGQGMNELITLSHEDYQVVGPHFRHVLDYYTNIIQGLESQTILLERERDPQIETDLGYAIWAADKTQQGIMRLPQGNLTIDKEILLESGVYKTPTFLNIELDFANTHVPHHFYFMKLLLPNAGFSADFGKNRSTLAYEQGQGN